MWKWVGVAVLLAWLLTTPAAAQAGAGLLITEVQYNTPGNDELEEWIELANFGSEAIALDDYKLGDEETFGGQEGMQRFPRDTQIAPDEVIVIARTASGFEALFGRKPTYEMFDSDPLVPNMRNFPILAGGETVLNNGGDELFLLDPTNAIVDALSYGDSDVVMQPPIAAVGRGESIERAPARCDSDSAADWQPQRSPTPFILALEGECDEADAADSTTAATAPTLPPIGDLQGSGPVAPTVNDVVAFDGVVTGMHADRNADGIVFHTVFVQDVPGTEDGDPATSDAMPVFFGRNAPDLQIGDHIRVEGQVTEFFGLTEIDDSGVAVQLLERGVPLPDPIRIDPPTGDDSALPTYFEPLEGMRVTLEDSPARVVGATFAGCGLSVVPPGSDTDRIVRHSAADPIGEIVPVLHHDETQCDTFPVVKAGDTLSGVAGPLTYHFDQYKIVLQADADVALSEAPLPPLPTMPQAGPGELSIATFNVENFFDEIDDTGLSAEPKLSPDEQATKRAKISHAIAELLHCPTLVAIQEVEKEALLVDLAADLTDPCGFTYAVSHRESVDGRGIDVALLSDPARVTVQAVNLRQGCTPIETGIEDDSADCPSDQQPLFSRPPLQTDLLIGDEPLTVFVNHFKSKRGGEAETAPRRLAQAEHINALVRDVLARDPGAAVLVTGDFNDYANAPAMQAMTSGDGVLTNVLWQLPEDERYSFVFSGASQLIDGMLLSPALAERLVAVDVLHTNADFPDAWGDDLSAERIAYKSTDHDIPLLVLQWGPENATEVRDATPQPAAEPVEAVATPVVESPEPAESGPAALIAALVLLGIIGFGGLLFWRRRR